MRKFVAVLCAGLLLSLFCTSCGNASVARESRVELTGRGRIVEYTVEDFSTSNYDPDELKDFIEEEIDAYKESNKGRIKVKTDKVKKDTAYLTLRYNNADTYAAFNDVVCFSGTVGEALEAGYDLSMEFTVLVEGDADQDSLGEGESTPRITVSGSTLAEDESLRVFLIETDADVTVPGEALYAWSSLGETGWESKDTVHVDAASSEFGSGNLVCVVYQ